MREALTPQPQRSTALIDPGLVETSRILHRVLVRVHPSFRFEERLAARLGVAAEEAREAGPALWDGRRGDLVPFPHAGRATARWPRGMLIGGAIASGVSIAGAAYLARRWLTRGA